MIFPKREARREAARISGHEEARRVAPAVRAASSHWVEEIPRTNVSRPSRMASAKLRRMTSSPYWTGSARPHFTAVTPGYPHIYTDSRSKVACWASASGRCGLILPGVCSTTSSGPEGPPNSSISETWEPRWGILMHGWPYTSAEAAT